MSSSAPDPIDTTSHPESDTESPTSSFVGADGSPVYEDLSPARSLNATLTAGTRLSATPTHGDERLVSALLTFFPTPVVADLSKHLFSLGNDAIEALAALLGVTVAPSNAFLQAYENVEAIKAYLFTNGYAQNVIIGGGVALVLPTARQTSGDTSPLPRNASLLGDAFVTTRVASSHSCSPDSYLARFVNAYAVAGIVTSARALLPTLPPPFYSTHQGKVAAADAASLLDALGSQLRDGAVVFAPPMEAATKMVFFVADNFPELITGPAATVKADLFRAITLLELPPYLHGSLLLEVVKELVRRLEVEIIGYLRLFPPLPEIMLERLRLLDAGHAPNAEFSVSGLVAKPYELHKFAKSLMKREDQSQSSAMLSFAAARDAAAGDPEESGGELPCVNRYFESLVAAAFRCSHFGVMLSLDENAHANSLRFIRSMTFKDPYKKKALQRVADQYSDAIYKIESPLPEHDFKVAQDYARRAVAMIAPLADKLRSNGAADEHQRGSRTVHKGAAGEPPHGGRPSHTPYSANLATSAGIHDTPAALAPKDHGLNFSARQAARGKCYFCGSNEHMVRDCDSSTQKCPLCLSDDHHCNQCPKLHGTAQQKNV